MPIDVFAADEQAHAPVELERWTALARAILATRGLRGHVEVSLLFVDRQTIASLNERFLGESEPTDVLAFPIEDEPPRRDRLVDVGGTGPGDGRSDDDLVLLGDVVICPAVAGEHAAREGVPLEDELALLVVHGILHLLGMDHQDEGEAEAMERLQRELLERHHRPDREVTVHVSDDGRRQRGERRAAWLEAGPSVTEVAND